MDLVDRLLGLWGNPPADDAAAEAAFRELYADPVLVNGVPLTARDLATRARGLHVTYDDLRVELLDRVETADRLAIGFRMTGRHTGPLDTPLGAVPPTGEPVELRVIDILTVSDGRITGIVMVADELGLLLRLGAVALR